MEVEIYNEKENDFYYNKEYLWNICFFKKLEKIMYDGWY